MSYKILALSLLLPFVVSEASAQITTPSHPKGETVVKWNPFDPDHTVVNPKGGEVVNEYEEEGSGSQKAPTDAENNDDSSN